MSATSSVAGPQELLLQLLDPANRANPYAVYQQFRDLGPVQVPDGNLTVFSSYRECDEALRHPSSSVDRFKSTMAKRMFAEGARARPQGPPMFLFLDPPDHTRLRKLVSKAFVPKVVNELTPHITELVDGLLDRAAEQGRFDAVSGLAYPLPVTVICGCWGFRWRTRRSSAAPRRCWRRRSIRFSWSPAHPPTAWTSAFEPGSGCGDTCTT